MINTSKKFLHSTPEKKSEMANDGMYYIGKRIHSMARELSILNSWLKTMVAEGNQIIDITEWENTKLDYSAAADTLTNAIVENAQLLKQLDHESKMVIQRSNIHSTVQR